jgi:phospholipid transport system substrate-binding protein
MKRLSAWALIAGMIAVSLPVAAATQGPEDVIREASDLTLDAIEGRREELRKNQEELFRVVDEILLPRWDRNYSGQLVMGKYWRDASDEQREQFITGLYRKLLRSYADGILEYRSEQLRLLSTKGNEADGKVLVETEVRLEDGTPVPVSYRLREGKDGQWKVYDVVIEGISYVANFRKQYASEFRTKGIKGVLEDLEAGRDTVKVPEPESEDSG